MIADCLSPEPPLVASPEGPVAAWYCLRSQVKHEEVAARYLRGMEEIEVFSPRTRFVRSSLRGPVEVIEAMFPGYLFARFDWQAALKLVHYAPGVLGVVHFGDKWPTIPDAVIEEIRASLCAGNVHTVSNEARPGDLIEVSGGPLHGASLVVSRAMPGSRRVTVLLEFLGRQVPTEVGVHSIIRRSPCG